MQLGNHLLLVIHTKDKKKSLAFYQKLGFRVLKKNTDNIILSRGKNLFLLHFGNLNKNIKLVSFCPKIALTAAKLRFKKIKTTWTKNKQQDSKEATFKISEKFGILLSNDAQYDISSESLTDEVATEKMGKFVEYGLYTKDFEADLLSLQSIGFKRVLYSECFSMSAILKHKQLQIGLYKNYENEEKHCLTFYSKNIQQHIDKLEKEGLKWAEKLLPNQTGGFNAAKLISPEQLDIWLFKSSVYGMKLINMPPSKASSYLNSK